MICCAFPDQKTSQAGTFPFSCTFCGTAPHDTANSCARPDRAQHGSGAGAATRETRRGTRGAGDAAREQRRGSGGAKGGAGAQREARPRTGIQRDSAATGLPQLANLRLSRVESPRGSTTCVQSVQCPARCEERVIAALGQRRDKSLTISPRALDGVPHTASRNANRSWPLPFPAPSASPPSPS